MRKLILVIFISLVLSGNTHLYSDKDLDMECRRLWAMAYGGSDLKCNKTFEPK